MKVIKEFLIGSKVFFEGMEGFTPKDTDKLCIYDRFIFPNNIMTVKKGTDDIFLCRNMDKEGFIKDTLETAKTNAEFIIN